MEVDCSKTDRISTLPKDIIDSILTLMPLGEAMKTSILSKKWRYKWANIPKLYMDYNMFDSYLYYFGSSVLENTLIHNAILHVLLLHTSPLLEFTLLINRNLSFEIDPIILYLSRKNSTLQRLTLANHSDHRYKLPISFFSFNKLEYLALKKFVCKPPLTFNSFCTLRYLCFYDNVEITTKSLKRILTNCPLLQELYLYGKKENGEKDNGCAIAEEDKLTFVELFESSPRLENLAIEKYYIENEQSNDSQSIAMDFLGLQEHSNFKLYHLNKLVMKNFSNLAIEMEFLKLIVTQAPVLQKIRIELNENFPVEEELKILKDELFSNASPSIKLMVERPIMPSVNKIEKQYYKKKRSETTGCT
ncbi:F-box/FBD/LRR-repeat protein At1g13570-like [Rutidosis leptorrhynchoides]|uniref:F-box/FBD/LRR-repeat protein At1g13570-like n=1 Tax=Rutidosis leptorrhynchoides TaxID=125765 RepID=UPI003A9A0B6B